MMTPVNELQLLERLCDPCLSAEEAAFGVRLTSIPDSRCDEELPDSAFVCDGSELCECASCATDTDE